MPASFYKTSGGANQYAAPTLANLQSLPGEGKGTQGVRSFARTEHSMRSYMSSLTSMSNFFRVTDSPLSGVIPSSVLRQAMEKRQQELSRAEGGAQFADGSGADGGAKQQVLDVSQDQQGSSGDTT